MNKAQDLALLGNYGSVNGSLVRRPVGSNGARLATMPGDEMIGDIEVASHDDARRLLRFGGWADIGHL